MSELPMLAVDLIEYLDKQYPHRCPRMSDNDREIWMYAGKRELVDTLIASLNELEDEKEASNVRVYT